MGTFTFTSSVPIAVIALRGFTNEAGEFLMTTLPVAPLSSSTETVVFPHFAAGGGWVTQVILSNPTDRTITGTVGFLGRGSGTAAAAPAILTLEDGSTGSSFEYSIPARSAQRFTTGNPSGALNSGSVRATPHSGNTAPSGLVVFSYVPAGKTLSEAGVPSLSKGSAFRVYVETSGNARTGRVGKKRTGHRQRGGYSQYRDSGGDKPRWIACCRPGHTHASTIGSGCPFPGRVLFTAGQLFRDAPGHLHGRSRHRWTAFTRQRERRTEGNDDPAIQRNGRVYDGGQISSHISRTPGVWSTQFILFSGTAGQGSSGTLTFVDAAGQPLDLSVSP